MNLIFIYGPPAAGKLTVATELQALTGYRLFHNHLTQDLVREIYPDFDEIRLRLVDRIRLDIFEYASQNKTNLIFTYVYDGDDGDKEFVERAVAAVERNGGKVHFIRLSAPDEILLERVGSESRQRYHKLKDPQILQEIMQNRGINPILDREATTTIDTSQSTPRQSARKILQELAL